jgi:hypothetical protein
MIGCGIGVRGAKRIGEMLEKNASLMTINLDGGCPLIISSSSNMFLVEDVHPKRE